MYVYKTRNIDEGGNTYKLETNAKLVRGEETLILGWELGNVVETTKTSNTPFPPLLKYPTFFSIKISKVFFGF